MAEDFTPSAQGLPPNAANMTCRFPAWIACRGVARQSKDWSSWGLELPAEAKLAKAKTGRFAAWPGKGSFPPFYFLSFSPQSSLLSPLPLCLMPSAKTYLSGVVLKKTEALYLFSIIHNSRFDTYPLYSQFKIWHLSSTQLFWPFMGTGSLLLLFKLNNF